MACDIVDLAAGARATSVVRGNNCCDRRSTVGRAINCWPCNQLQQLLVKGTIAAAVGQLLGVQPIATPVGLAQYSICSAAIDGHAATVSIFTLAVPISAIVGQLLVVPEFFETSVVIMSRPLMSAARCMAYV